MRSGEDIKCARGAANEFFLHVPGALLDAIADRVAERLTERLPNRPEPYLNSKQAAEYLACPRSRIFDLVEREVLEPHRDGRRLLFRASQLDAALSRKT